MEVCYCQEYMASLKTLSNVSETFECNWKSCYQTLAKMCQNYIYVTSDNTNPTL